MNQSGHSILLWVKNALLRPEVRELQLTGYLGKIKLFENLETKGFKNIEKNHL